MQAVNAVKLNDKGQCPECNEVPRIINKWAGYSVCPRCQRGFDPVTGEQVANLAWIRVPGSSPPTFVSARRW